MELLVLALVLLFTRSGYKYNRESVYKYQETLKEIDEHERRVYRKLDSARWLLSEAERTGDAKYLEYAIEERKKAEELIEEFKIKYKL